MKNFILFLIASMLVSCTSYQTVTLEGETALYKNKNNKDSLYVIPAKTQVYLSKKKSKYRKIRYGDYRGWVTEPIYTEVQKEVNSTSTASSYRPKKNSNASASGGTVNVKGYTRKDGTYVKPHTRKTPKKH